MIVKRLKMVAIGFFALGDWKIATNFDRVHSDNNGIERVFGMAVHFVICSQRMDFFFLRKAQTFTGKFATSGSSRTSKLIVSLTLQTYQRN